MCVLKKIICIISIVSLYYVNRRSHSVLRNTLPQKEEYVILVRMTSFQRKLYDTFMNEVVRTKAVPNPLKAFAVCCKVRERLLIYIIYCSSGFYFIFLNISAIFKLILRSIIVLIHLFDL